MPSCNGVRESCWWYGMSLPSSRHWSLVLFTDVRWFMMGWWLVASWLNVRGWEDWAFLGKIAFFRQCHSGGDMCLLKEIVLIWVSRLWSIWGSGYSWPLPYPQGLPMYMVQSPLFHTMRSTSILISHHFIVVVQIGTPSGQEVGCLDIFLQWCWQELRGREGSACRMFSLLHFELCLQYICCGGLGRATGIISLFFSFIPFWDCGSIW
jgi:hypothetical protein